MPGATREPPHCLGLAPRFLGGVLEVPVHHMRGGTSTGVVLYEGHLPGPLELREELVRHVMGVPQAGEAPGNRQITGLGRGIPQSNKVFIVARSARPDADIDSTLAQLAADKSAIDWSVNCGNMSAALPAFAFEIGLLAPAAGASCVRIHNTNTGVVTHALLDLPEPGAPARADAAIPGVIGRWPGVQLALLDPAGAKTGRLLPTGSPVDRVEGLDVSCVDLAVPMVIARAADLGRTAGESPAALDADRDLVERLRRIWVAAGLKMTLKGAGGDPLTVDQLAASETIPKICIIAEPDARERAVGANLRVRYFTPQASHKSLAVTGGACLAAACLVPGTVANALAVGLDPVGEELRDHVVQMANPAGLLKATVQARLEGGAIAVPRAAYERSTQLLLRGHTPLYHASPALCAWYAERVPTAIPA